MKNFKDVQSKLKPIFLMILFAFVLIINISWASDKRCMECHQASIEKFKSGHHAKAFALDASKENKNCSNCHLGTEKHNKCVESIYSFSKKSVQTPKERSSPCLKCHENSKMVINWNTSKHKKNDLSCNSCHTVHTKAGTSKPSHDVCLNCHRDINSDIKKLSHHPIKEGKVDCINCHNPHGVMGKTNLKAESAKQLCYKCHADKRGPYMWEHPPVQENCLNCHKVHGSIHPKLLAEKQVALCQNCHLASTGHVSTVYSGLTVFGNTASNMNGKGIARQCLNCHNNIHGSNAPGNPNSRSNSSGKPFMR
ncbi:MAG: DmsE family decaheme c-type cytochrome [Oligoflexia bacterium]|nr:DmsE family decaheme c-type cytochrome [Oligoflexia bacterium]